MVSLFGLCWPPTASMALTLTRSEESFSAVAICASKLVVGNTPSALTAAARSNSSLELRYDAILSLSWDTLKLLSKDWPPPGRAKPILRDSASKADTRDSESWNWSKLLVRNSILFIFSTPKLLSTCSQCGCCSALWILFTTQSSIVCCCLPKSSMRTLFKKSTSRYHVLASLIVGNPSSTPKTSSREYTRLVLPELCRNCINSCSPIDDRFWINIKAVISSAVGFSFCSKLESTRLATAGLFSTLASAVVGKEEIIGWLPSAGCSLAPLNHVWDAQPTAAAITIMAMYLPICIPFPFYRLSSNQRLCKTLAQLALPINSSFLWVIFFNTCLPTTIFLLWSAEACLT